MSMVSTPRMALASSIVDRSRRLVALLVGGALLLAAAPAQASPGAAPAEQASAPARAPSSVLRVQVAPAVADAELIPGWIAERNPRLAEEVPALAGHEQWIEIVLAGETYDYRVIVTAMRDGAVVGPSAELVRCECTSEQLLARLDDEIARAVDRLQAPPPEPEPTPAPRATAPTPTTPTPSERLDPPRRAISGLGTVGIVATALGVAGVASGAAMMALHPKPPRGSTALDGAWGWPGELTLVTSGTVLVAGVSMLVADVVQCRKASAPRRCHARRREPRFQAGPSLEASGAGVHVKGRF